jgi:HK97 family phage major capsid protein
MEDKHSLDELRAHSDEVTERIKKIATEYDGREFPPDTNEEFEALKEERSKTDKLIVDLEQRAAFIESLSDRPENLESEQKFSFQTRKSNLPDRLTDIDEYRVRATSIEGYDQLVRDGAMKLVDTRIRSRHPNVKMEEFQGDMESLINLDQEVAIRAVTTQDPGYQDEWRTYLRTYGQVVGPMMQRTASLTNTAGGYAVPVELDTTLFLTNAGVVNPIRGIARVRQTNGNVVDFINTTGIVAGFGAEATEASDNAPVLAQPVANVEKAFAFVPYSIEIGEDWAGFQTDMSMAFADAKNQLESQQFLTGLGHASHAPQGLIAANGATAIITTATTAVFALADLYSLELALSPRYRPNATLVGSKAAFQKIRGFGTASGPSAWTDNLRVGYPSQVLGYNAAEWSAYAATPTTSGSTIVTLGDFSYFAIVDKVGMNIDNIPHLFGGSNRYPTGQRGLYMYWRTTSQVLSPTLGANSAFVSVKVL